jgi:dihydroneopterin aldolase
MMKIKESYIYLSSLRFHAYHGVMPQERLTGNDYEVSLKIGYDVSNAAISDEVDDTLNYAGVYDIVAQEMQVPSKLLERVAWRIGDRLFRRYAFIFTVDLRLTKLNPPMGADSLGAGVELHLINDKTK